jgi:hypothetical protein
MATATPLLGHLSSEKTDKVGHQFGTIIIDDLLFKI